MTLPAATEGPGTVDGVGVALTISKLSISPLATLTSDPAIVSVVVVAEAEATTGCSGSEISRMFMKLIPPPLFQ